MNNTFTYILYGATAFLLILSFCKDRHKTVLSLKRAWKMFINVLPQFIAVLLLTGLLLTAVTPEIIGNIIGAESGFPGVIITSLLGSVTLVPVIIAFPVAAELLENGAGITQTAVFISTLTMVGIVTLPIEIKYLGKKVSILRNLLAYLLAITSSVIIKAVMA